MFLLESPEADEKYAHLPWQAYSNPTENGSAGTASPSGELSATDESCPFSQKWCTLYYKKTSL